VRTFLAITLPAALQLLIRQEQQQIETGLAAAHQPQAIRWTAPAAVHLTLRFLGETTDRQRQALAAHLTRLTADQKPFTLTMSEVGCFPNLRTPNIIWLGLQSADQALFHLQHQLEQAAQTVGFAAEHKPFRPHLTIGRTGRRVEQSQLRTIGQLLTRHLAAAQAPRHPPVGFVVNQFVHMQSQLQPTGAVYTPLQVFNFAEAEK
jgi:RNA 2',3'-cyclic 3'-phosphodiesterase